MRTSFRSSFLRDVRNVRDAKVHGRVQIAIGQVEQARTLSDIPQLKRLHGQLNAYRLRVGEYRIGCVIEGDVVDFVRCLHRRDIYRYFP